MSLIQREPAMVTAVVTGFVDATIILLVAFGVPVTPDQKVALIGFVSAAIALVGFLVSGVVTRAQVTPNNLVPLEP